MTNSTDAGFRRRLLVVRGIVLLLTLLWGTTWSAIRIGLTGVPPFTGVALRFALASAILFAVGPLFSAPWPRGRRLWGVATINGLLLFCGSYAVVYWCEQFIPSGLAAVLFATFPLLTMLLAHVMLPGERLTLGAVSGALLGFGGIAVVFSDDLTALGGAGVRLGAAVMLLSPLVSAVANVTVKRWGHDLHPVTLSALSMALGAAGMGLAALGFEHGRPVAFTLRSIGALVYLAVFGSAVTFCLYYWLLARYRAGQVSLIAYGTPIVAVLIGTLFMKEPITGRMLAGGALVIFGVFLATRSAAQRSGA